MNPSYQLGDLAVFSVGAHPELSSAICEYLHIPLGRMEVKKFNNENTFVRILENVRSRDVFFVQPTAAPVNDNTRPTRSLNSPIVYKLVMTIYYSVILQCQYQNRPFCVSFLSR